MAFIIDAALDAGLNYVRTNTTTLYICSQEPTTLTEATTTYALGSKASPSIAAPADRTGGGRQCTVSAITDGSVTANGTASHFALVSGTELLATEALSSTQVVTSGNVFTLTSFEFGIPDAV